ncbi:MAG TPA: alpha/beta hydrolase [Candidatus Anammoximicrobium sp.]|nr:alpha/beta hydrolase [Candidatus Anammoximicrobium sp.]
MRRLRVGAGLLICVSITAVSMAAEAVKIVPDVVYGHKFGLALTFDVFQPVEKANGAGVLFMVSGGWYSSWQPPEKAQGMFKPLTDKGLTVFAVRHGSSPKFGIAEAVEDVRRAVRYIRVNAQRFGVDPQRLGVYGYSAGGHLSLMLGTASDEGDPKADDPVLRAGNRVQAVVAFVAPTDLRIMVWKAPDHLPAYNRFPALDLTVEEAARVSPLLQVTPDDAPTLLIAGDADELVPIKHSRDIQAAFQEKGVKSQLIEISGAGHGFGGEDAKRATSEMAAWFEKQLANPSGTE